MAKAKIKTLLGTGLAALCSHIKQCNTAIGDLSEATANGFEETDDILHEKQDVTAAVSFTIPVDGWGEDDSFPGYFYCDIPIAGLLATDIVDVTVLPKFYDVAEQAVGFPLKAPGELGAPEKIQVISGAVAQLNWPEGISYRVARGSQEVSGSYTAYGWERSQSAGEQMVTIKGNGDWTYLAAWKDGTYSHALAFEQGVSAQRAVSLVGDLVPLSGE